MNANEIPNLAKRMNTAMRAPSALKKMTRRMPPAVANQNDIMYESLTPKMFMSRPET